MNKTFIYPGSFCPPTYGHLHIVKTFAEQYDQPLIIICSENPDKQGKAWFTPEQCKKMWETYNLPSSVVVETLEEFKLRLFDKDEIVMVRGLRNEEDAEYERKVMVYNKEHFNITQYLYIFGDKSYANVSSSSVRERAIVGDFHDLYLDVSLGVVTELWKRVLQVKNIYMVVGRPGSGKTTILELMQARYPEVCYINTDKYNEALKPKLKEYFKTDNLFEIAKTREQELIQVISKSWLTLLFNDMLNTPEDSTEYVLVEIAYGLQQYKELYRFLGENVIFIGCKNNYGRNKGRNTEHLAYFIDKIPDEMESRNIAMDKGLNLHVFTTDLDSAGDVASRINKLIERIGDN